MLFLKISQFCAYNLTFCPFSVASTLTPIIWSSKVSPLASERSRSGGLSSHITSLFEPASIESSQALTDPSNRPETRSCEEMRCKGTGKFKVVQYRQISKIKTNHIRGRSQKSEAKKVTENELNLDNLGVFSSISETFSSSLIWPHVTTSYLF